MNRAASLDSDLLRTFLTVARHGSVTHSAAALALTQSAVSIQIKRLEAALGATLFRREPRGVSLTEAGERLRPAAERIVGELDRTLCSFRADPIAGLVSVGIPDEYGSDVLPSILADFTARYPAVEVIVHCGFSMRFPDAVARGELDLAVFADAGGGAPAGKLIEDPMVWVASRPCRCRRDEPLALALFDRSCWWRDLATDTLQAAGQPYRVAFSSESVAGIKAAIATGLAVGVLARSTVAGAMQVLGEAQGFPALPGSVLRLVRARTGSPAVDAMAEAIEAGFARLR